MPPCDCPQFNCGAFTFNHLAFLQSILVLFCCLLCAVHTIVHTNMGEWIFIFYLFFKTVALGKLSINDLF